MKRVPESIRSRRVFFDSAGFYALSDERSQDHEAAAAAFARYSREHRSPFTTNFVVAETHALVLNRLGYSLAVRFLHRIDQGAATIVRVKASDEQRAREIIFADTDKDYSLTDATSFAVMERLGIDTAFTFDRHFAQFGFRVVGPE